MLDGVAKSGGFLRRVFNEIALVTDPVGEAYSVAVLSSIFGSNPRGIGIRARPTTGRGRNRSPLRWHTEQVDSTARLEPPAGPYRLWSLVGAAAGSAALSTLSIIPGTAGGAAPPSPKQVLGIAAHRTLDQRSFTVLSAEGGEDVGRLDYQAPDRTESQPLGQMIVIGHTVYKATTLTQSGEVTQWTPASLTDEINRVSGPMAAKAQLDYLLKASSVTAARKGYDFQETIPLSQLDPGGRGQALMMGNVSVSNGLVRAISLAYFVDGTKKGPNYQYEFTSFNRSPQIVPPPASETVRARTCIDAMTHQPIPGFTCGAAG